MKTQLVTIYSRPGCVQCNATYRALDSRGIAYTVVDVSQDADAAVWLRSQGHMQAPVVVTTTAGTWTGFRPDKIEQLDR